MISDGWSLLGYGLLAAFLIAVAVTVLLVHFINLTFLGGGMLIAVIVLSVYWLARFKEHNRKRN